MPLVPQKKAISRISKAPIRVLQAPSNRRCEHVSNVEDSVSVDLEVDEIMQIHSAARKMRRCTTFYQGLRWLASGVGVFLVLGIAIVRG